MKSSTVTIGPPGCLRTHEPHQVYFNVDHQSFRVGPVWDDKFMARWYARQLRIALERLIGKTTKRKAKP